MNLKRIFVSHPSNTAKQHGVASVMWPTAAHALVKNAAQQETAGGHREEFTQEVRDSGSSHVASRRENAVVQIQHWARS